MVGEIGGVYEERSAERVSQMNKPVVFMIGGITAPPGKRMGHAGAIVEGEMGTAQHKVKILQEAGAHWAKTFQDIPRILKEQGV
jgi:succinyl-CoA synthetase alpha subunit